MNIASEIETIWRRIDVESDLKKIRAAYDDLLRRSPYIKEHLRSVGAQDALVKLQNIPTRLDARDQHLAKQLKEKEEAQQLYLTSLGIEQEFYRNFLHVDAWFERELIKKHLSDSDVEFVRAAYQTRKLEFVRSWVAMNTPKTKNGENSWPDDEQTEAIAAVNGHIQVIARAGSGKTTTLVNRVLFLLKHCRIAAAEILILAFNRKAALEVRRRLLVLIDQNAEPEIAAEINRRVKDARQKQHRNWDEIEAGAVDAIASQLKITLPHVMTFHALAYAIVHPEESLLYNGAEGESQGLSRAFQQVIDDHLREPAFREKSAN